VFPFDWEACARGVRLLLNKCSILTEKSNRSFSFVLFASSPPPIFFERWQSLAIETLKHDLRGRGASYYYGIFMLLNKN
jgi:hypothetical protein